MGTLPINILTVLGETILPPAAAIMGFILLKKPPEINSKFGFRTKLSTRMSLLGISRKLYPES